jgi:hypothetical protein
VFNLRGVLNVGEPCFNAHTLNTPSPFGEGDGG